MRHFYDRMAEADKGEREALYCPNCQMEVTDPLVYGDCAAVICRTYGAPLKKVDELGKGYQYAARAFAASTTSAGWGSTASSWMG